MENTKIYLPLWTLLLCANAVWAQLPVVNLGNDTTICGSSYGLDANNAGATFAWSTGATSQSITTSSSGTYWVDVTNANGTTRDSIVLTLLPTPSFALHDTTVCIGTRTLPIYGSSSNYYFWWDAPSGGNLVNIGQTFTTVFSTNATYYANALVATGTYSEGILTNTATNIYDGYYNQTTTTGVVFNASQSIFLQSVTIYIGTGTITGTIQLLNASSTVLNSVPVTLSAGANVIPLNFFIPQGTNYQLLLANPSGSGTLFASLPVTFPLNYGHIQLVNEVPFYAPFDINYHFYNWQIVELGCASPRQAINVTTNATPTINIPSDTTLCGNSLTLNATFPSATYLWSTGATTATVTLNQSDTVSVIASIGSCAAYDTARVQLFPLPSFAVHDTTVCIGTRTLPIYGASNNSYFWWDAATGGNLVNLGQTFTNNFTTNDTLFVNTYNTTGIYSEGIPNNTVTNQYDGYYNQTTTTGVVFNASQSVFLQSVTIYIGTGTLAGTIQLLNSSNTVINSLPVSLSAGANVIPLNFFVPQGSNYQLLLANPSGSGTLFASLPVTFPLNYGHIQLVNEVPFYAPFDINYNFYNWQIAELGCPSPRQPLRVTVNPTPVLNLPADTTLCASSVVLNATYAGAVYSWSTGATTATTTVTQSGNVSVTASIGSCAAYDTARVHLYPYPTFAVHDTAICAGTRTLPVYGASTNNYFWWDAATGGNLVNLGQTFTNNFTANTTYYVNTQVPINTYSEGILSNTVTNQYDGYYNQTSTTGVVFNALQSIFLQSVTIYVSSGSATATIKLLNSSGSVLDSSNVSLAVGTNVLPLNFFIPQGSNYQLLLANPVGNATWFASLPVTFPLTYGHIQLVNEVPYYAPFDVYHAFYNWQIAELGCPSPRQAIAVTTNPNPVIQLPVDTTSCTNSLTLDATFAGANYLWSTGQTTATITLAQSDTVSVTASLGSCTTSQTSRVHLYPLPVFSLHDTTICAGIATLPTYGASTNNYFWWDAASGGNLLNIGQLFVDTFMNTDTLFVNTVAPIGNYSEGIPDNTTPFSFGGYYNQTATIGLVFNASQSIFLQSVTMYIGTGTVTGTIQLLNASGVLLDSAHVTLIAGVNVLPLQFFVPQGNGYRLLLVNPTGAGTIHASLPVTFPLTYGHIQIVNEVPYYAPFDIYHGFYNWQIAELGCPSPRQALRLSVNPSPVVNLPVDTANCVNPVVLNVANAGANYLWSTGATTSSITVNQNSIVRVSVTIGNCHKYDTVNVLVLDTAQFSVHDTTFCAGLHTLAVNGSSAFSYYWWNAATGGTLASFGQTIQPNLLDTTTFYVEGRTAISTDYEGIANNTILSSTNSGYYTAPDTRGLLFDVLSPFVLRSVTMYADGLIRGTIALQDSAGNTLSSVPIQLATGTQIVPLNFSIPNIGKYRLVLMNETGGGRLWSDIPNTSPFPLTYPHIRIAAAISNNIIQTSGISSRIYFYFYNWEIIETACPSSRHPLTATVLPTPAVTLPADTVFCSASAAVSVSYPSATYHWNNGATTNSITTTQNGLFVVTTTIGQCSDVDSIEIFIAAPPSSITPPNDTIICGGLVTLHASTDGFTSAWYAVPTGGQPIAVADSVTLNLQDSTTIWVEGLGFLPKSNYYGATAFGAPSSNIYINPSYSNYKVRGIQFDVARTIMLNQVSVYVDSAAVTADILLLDANDFVLQQLKGVSMPILGENVITLDWTLLPASGYKIVLDSVQGGRLNVQGSFSYPLVYPELVMQRGVPAVVSNFYNYFRKWRISTPSCATARVPVQIDVPPYPVLTMPADTAVCNAVGAISIAATATNSGYTYHWSNGATTNTNTVSSSGLYTVTVSNGGLCSVAQNSLIQFQQTPANPAVNDTSLCAAQTIPLLTNPTNALWMWYNSPTQLQYLGAPYNVHLVDTTQFDVALAARTVTRLGRQNYPTPNLTSLYNGFIIATTFDVNDWVILDSVAVYADVAPASFEIELRDAQGMLLQSRIVSVAQPFTKTLVPLEFTIAPAMGYQLEFANINGIRFLGDANAPFPAMSSAGVVELTGTSLVGVNYSPFFDWHFSYASPICVSASRDSFEVDIKLPLTLADTAVFVCDSLLLDVSIPAGVSYHWSTGATTSAVTLYNAGLYTVTVSDGVACAAVDSVTITQPQPVGLPTNGVSCNNILYTNYTTVTGASFEWSTGETTASISIPNTGQYFVTVTTPQGCTLVDSTTINILDYSPFFDLGFPRSACSGNMLDLSWLSPQPSFIWNTGATTSTVTLTSSMTYSVTATSANGCSTTDNVFMSITPLPTANFSIAFTSGLFVGISNTSLNTVQYYIEYGDSTPATLNASHNYATDGCYTIRLVAINACGRDTMELDTAIGTGVPCGVPVTTLDKTMDFDFEIAPNPNQGECTLLFNQPLPNDALLKVIDINGQVVWQQSIQTPQISQYSVSLPQLAAGVYIVQLIHPKHQQIKRMVVNRN